MSKVYVLMREATSPIAVSIPRPVQVFPNKKDAVAEAKKRNDSPNVRNYYYVRSATMWDSIKELSIHG